MPVWSPLGCVAALAKGDPHLLQLIESTGLLLPQAEQNIVTSSVSLMTAAAHVRCEWKASHANGKQVNRRAWSGIAGGLPAQDL